MMFEVYWICSIFGVFILFWIWLIAYTIKTNSSALGLIWLLIFPTYIIAFIIMQLRLWIHSRSLI